MSIRYKLLNFPISEVSQNIMELDFSEGMICETTGAADILQSGEGFQDQDSLTVMSYTDNFVTFYGYKTWKKKFAR